MTDLVLMASEMPVFGWVALAAFAGLLVWRLIATRKNGSGKPKGGTDGLPGRKQN